jgi:hypothetical protein
VRICASSEEHSPAPVMSFSSSPGLGQRVWTFWKRGVSWSHDLDQGIGVLDSRTLPCVVDDGCHVAQKGCRNSMMSFGRVNYIRPESTSAHDGLLTIALIAISRCLSSFGDLLSVTLNQLQIPLFYILLILPLLYRSVVLPLRTLQPEEKSNTISIKVRLKNMQTAGHYIGPWSYLASQRDSASFTVLLASTGAHILDEVDPSVSKSPYIPKIWLSTLRLSTQIQDRLCFPGFIQG